MVPFHPVQKSPRLTVTQSWPPTVISSLPAADRIQNHLFSGAGPLRGRPCQRPAANVRNGSIAGIRSMRGSDPARCQRCRSCSSKGPLTDTMSSPFSAAWLAQGNQSSLDLALLALLAPQVQQRHFDRAQLPGTRTRSRTCKGAMRRQFKHLAMCTQPGGVWRRPKSRGVRSSGFGRRGSGGRIMDKNILRTPSEATSRRCAALWQAVPVAVYILVHVQPVLCRRLDYADHRSRSGVIGGSGVG